MVMRLVGEEAGLCLKNKNRDKQSVIRMSETDGVGGLADLTPKVRFRLPTWGMYS